MWLSLICRKLRSVAGNEFCGLCDLGEGFRREDAAADRPKQARAGPSHALKKPTTINAVVFVVVRNVIGHNIWFWFGLFVREIVLHLSLLTRLDFIPEIFGGEAGIADLVPLLLLLALHLVSFDACLCKNAALRRGPSAAFEVAELRSVAVFSLRCVRSAGQRSD